MTPKEKAEELVHKYRMLLMNADTDCGEEILVSILSVQCALIAVGEIIKSRGDDGAFDDTLSSNSSEYYTSHPMYLTYWLQVKQEIEAL